MKGNTKGVVLAVALLAALPDAAWAMDPVDWSPTAQLPTNAFSVYGTQRIDILDVGQSGVTNDGTIFQGEPNPTQPSTGTGVFEPFVRVQRSSGACGGGNDCLSVNGTKVGSQNGFNTDQQNTPNFDTKVGTWTHSVTMSEFNITGSSGYIELQLDANQNGSATSDMNKLVITDLQIFIGSDPNLANPEALQDANSVEKTGYDGKIFDPSDNSLLGLTPVWQLDSAANGNVDVLLQASICDNNGQCGSGKGDMNVFIPVEHLGAFGPNDYFVFYSEYLYVNDGFEEWRFSNQFVGNQVPEPGTLAVFGFGIVGLGAIRRRRRNS